MSNQPNITLPRTPAGSYKQYVALLTQTGTNAPVATVLNNTLGDIVWTRDTTGYYEAALTNGFPSDRTFILTKLEINTVGTLSEVSAKVVDVNTIQLSTYSMATAPADGRLENSVIEIRVYNDPTDVLP